MMPERFDEVVECLQKARERNVDRGWAGLLYFGEILELASNSRLIDLSPNERNRLNDCRNGVTHHDRLLVEKHEDVRELASIRNLCEKLMRGSPN